MLLKKNKIYRRSCLAGLLGLSCLFGSAHIAAEADCKREAHPETWPKQESPIVRDSEIEKRVADLLAKMTLEEKVGQVIQPDIAAITPEEAKEYNVGSVLNGGNSAPNGDVRAKADAWLALADQFWLASVDKSDGGLGIPLLWGTDAVHGHNNIVGATVFPHNIGLGAANDPELIHRIAEATAKEILVTGLDWTFAPTVAVVQNDRWGRTYESYSEDPKVVADYSGAFVSGLQGKVGSDEFLNESHLLATVKHFVGDGGTKDGLDQGDNQASEEDLRDIHAAGYPTAIRDGALVAMASFNSWCGDKMHGMKSMLTDILRGRMGFDGFVVGDWNGHGQVKGCNNASCANAFNAGLDMFMVPTDWKGLYANTLQQVKSGEITQERLDEAVARILRVKFMMGLFDAKKPSERKYAGQYELLGRKEHRAIAREAVRKSLVLLKNDNNLLPLKPKQRVLVAGRGADDIGMQSGGWTLSWQGTGNKNSDFPNGDSILDGIKSAVKKAGGRVEYNKSGRYKKKPDVAIVVFGEEPYAEFRGDRHHVDYPSDDGLQILEKLKSEGIPTVSVFLSGRAMWVNPELNRSDAFVAAWLPGTEGAGVADLLFRKSNGDINHDFVGRLTFSWPNKATDVELNFHDEEYSPLFAYGYGLSVKQKQLMPLLSENSGLDAGDTGFTGVIVRAGDPVGTMTMNMEDGTAKTLVELPKSVSAANIMTAQATDDAAQEDTTLVQWRGTGSLTLEGGPYDFSEYEKDGFVMMVRYKVSGGTSGKTTIGMRCGDNCSGDIDLSQQFAAKNGNGWMIGELDLKCFKDAGVDLSKVTHPFVITSGKGMEVSITDVKLYDRVASQGCHFW